MKEIKWIAVFGLLAIALINVGIIITYQFTHPELAQTQCTFDCWLNITFACLALILSKLLTNSLKGKGK